jgi:hypothetical protein
MQTLAITAGDPIPVAVQGELSPCIKTRVVPNLEDGRIISTHNNHNNNNTTVLHNTLNNRGFLARYLREKKSTKHTKTKPAKMATVYAPKKSRSVSDMGADCRKAPATLSRTTSSTATLTPMVRLVEAAVP